MIILKFLHVKQAHMSVNSRECLHIFNRKHEYTKISNSQNWIHFIGVLYENEEKKNSVF